MSAIFSNTPGTAASDFEPLPKSLHSGKESAMSVEEEDASQVSCPPPRSPSPCIKKEQHPSEESDTDPFIPADTYLKLNPMEEESTKKNPKSQKNKEEKPLLNEPVVISTSITTTHVKDLHELCQSQVRMTPSFEVKAELPLGFCAILRLAGPEGIQEFEAKGPYPSKKHAREAAAGLGLDYLKSLPKNSKSMMHENPEKDDTNWVGNLSDWCNLRKIRPEIIDYATPGAGFSCEIKLPVDPGYPGLEDEVFGDKNAAFKNKRSAKVAASKAAVIWLQKNSPAPSPSGSVSGGSKKSGKLGKVSRDVIYPKGSKPAAIVNLVCPRLGVNTPEYKLTPDPRTPGMYDVCAIIRRPNGPKDVMIGPVKNLYGKKKAREEMSVGVYNWIKKEAERQGVGIHEAADTDEP